jgi:YD repeat-containing protein
MSLADVDRFGLGTRWGWPGSFVDVEGGVRVFPASGGVYYADASQPSGLSGYVLGDVFFTQKEGVLPAREGVGATSYAFSLAYTGGTTDYFNTAGDVIARVEVFGTRIDWVWEPAHRLVGVVDGAGSRAQIVWGESEVSIVGPQRSDLVSPVTVLEVSDGRLVSVTNPVAERVTFGYGNGGLLDTAWAASGAVTEVSYQKLQDSNVVVDQVRVLDSATGKQLSVREWDVVGDHTAHGWPKYASLSALSTSGDGEFRYKTQLSDGATRMVSEFNSQGLMVARTMLASSPIGDVAVQEQKFRYPGTESGGVADPQLLPKQYQRPTHTTVIFRDQQGRMREVSEQTVFDDAGRITKEVSADGQVTETVYDTVVPSGMVLPVGLVLQQTTTGVDGSVSRTVNTPTVDHKAIAATEQFVGANGDAFASTSRTEIDVQPDGFVSEKRIVAVGEPSAGPGIIVTQFTRTIDQATITVSQTDAANTPAESTVLTVIDKASGLTLTATDAVGRIAKTTYDAVGRVLTDTDLAGLQTVTQYGDKVTRVTNPVGVTRSEYVDVLGQVIKVTDNISGGVPVVLTDVVYAVDG